MRFLGGEFVDIGISLDIKGNEGKHGVAVDA